MTTAPIPVPRPHPATLDDDALLRVCHVGRGRASGPGGQHRNKVETLVELTHEPTGVHVHAGERRSAQQNKHVATFRLRLALAVRCRAPVPLGEARSELWLSRCPDAGGGRIACNAEHRDYPSLVAEALDVLWACSMETGRCAARLCCTPSQLVKLLQDHPPAIVWVNQQRAERGLHALH